MKRKTVKVTKNYMVIRTNGEMLNLTNRTGEVIKRGLIKTIVKFTEGTFPILNTALKKELN